MAKNFILFLTAVIVFPVCSVYADLSPNYYPDFDLNSISARNIPLDADIQIPEPVMLPEAHVQDISKSPNVPSPVISFSDGLLTNFLQRLAEGSDFDLNPKGHDGGIKLRADGRVELSAKAYMREVILKPNVYFVVEIIPVLTAPNTLSIRFEKIRITKAYGIGIPDFINSLLQGKIIKSALNSITSNSELTKAMTANRLDDKTIELKLKNEPFPPFFAQGVTIKSMRIQEGMMHLEVDF